MKKPKIIVPALYLLGAVFVWLNFSKLPPDGLANIGIVLYTLPVVLIASLATSRQFPYLHGPYYQAHAVYFSLSVVIMTIVLFFVTAWIEKVCKTKKNRNMKKQVL